MLKLQYFGHLMQRVDSLEKTLMLGNIEGKRRRGWQRMRWLDSITNPVDMNLCKLQEIVKGRGDWCATVHGITESDIVTQQQQHGWHLEYKINQHELWLQRISHWVLEVKINTVIYTSNHLSHPNSFYNNYFSFSIINTDKWVCQSYPATRIKTCYQAISSWPQLGNRS